MAFEPAPGPYPGRVEDGRPAVPALVSLNPSGRTRRRRPSTSTPTIDVPKIPRAARLARRDIHGSRKTWESQVYSLIRRIVIPSEEPDVSTIDPPSTPPASHPRLLVSLATFDEAENLEPLVHEIRKYVPQADILVIDDNSPDGTGAIADRLRETLPGIHVIHRAGKLGLGTAILAGMAYAIDNGFDYFLNLDADFSHPPHVIPNLLAGMESKDVMIGSRYVPGGGVEGQFNLKRKFMSTGINWYARLLLGLRTKDNSGSFRCYRVSKLRQIDLTKVKSRGYSFMEEILYWCRTVGCTMGETPIIFGNRRSGYSKINKGEAVKALQIILQLGIGRALGNGVVAHPKSTS
jgi:dolichol-phosphate mannosyltransferase